MSSYNKVTLMGNLTRDPELRHTPQGTSVGQFGLALNRKRGETEETTFVEIVVWAKQAETCAEFLKKGRLVLVEGRLQQDRWQAEDGANRSRLVVVGERVQFLPNGNGHGNGHGKTANEPEGAEAPVGEEVPF
jgi:single-strand DNA-binding protein